MGKENAILPTHLEQWLIPCQTCSIHNFHKCVLLCLDFGKPWIITISQNVTFCLPVASSVHLGHTFLYNIVYIGIICKFDSNLLLTKPHFYFRNITKILGSIERSHNGKATKSSMKTRNLLRDKREVERDHEIKLLSTIRKENIYSSVWMRCDVLVRADPCILPNVPNVIHARRNSSFLSAWVSFSKSQIHRPCVCQHGNASDDQANLKVCSWSQDTS